MRRHVDLAEAGPEAKIGGPIRRSVEKKPFPEQPGLLVEPGGEPQRQGSGLKPRHEIGADHGATFRESGDMRRALAGPRPFEQSGPRPQQPGERKRAGTGKSVSVRVDLGGRRNKKKKK